MVSTYDLLINWFVVTVQNLMLKATPNWLSPWLLFDTPLSMRLQSVGIHAQQMTCRSKDQAGCGTQAHRTHTLGHFGLTKYQHTTRPS